VDASVIEVDASRVQRVEGSEVSWTPGQRASRHVSEYLVALEIENPPINPNKNPRRCRPPTLRRPNEQPQRCCQVK
jgi:hypothetical protein